MIKRVVVAVVALVFVVHVASSQSDLEALYSYLSVEAFRLSHDSFVQLSNEGSSRYELDLETAMILAPRNLQPGQGVVIESRFGDELQMRLHKSLLEVLPDGSQWWQIEQTQLSWSRETMVTAFAEVMVSREGFILIVRYRHVDAGSYHEVVVFDPAELEAARAQMPEEQLTAAIAERQAESAQNTIRFLQMPLRPDGATAIQTPAGFVSSKRFTGEADGTRAELFLSPEVPGEFARFVMSRGDQRLVTELVAVTNNNVAVISGDLITPHPSELPLANEGSPEAPIALTVGQEHWGTVGPNGQSHYSVEIRESAELVIAVDYFNDFVGLNVEYQDDESMSSSSTVGGYRLETDLSVSPGGIVIITVSGPGSGRGTEFLVLVTER